MVRGPARPESRREPSSLRLPPRPPARDRATTTTRPAVGGHLGDAGQGPGCGCVLGGGGEQSARPQVLYQRSRITRVHRASAMPDGLDQLAHPRLRRGRRSPPESRSRSETAGYVIVSAWATQSLVSPYSPAANATQCGIRERVAKCVEVTMTATTQCPQVQFLARDDDDGTVSRGHRYRRNGKFSGWTISSAFSGPTGREPSVPSRDHACLFPSPGLFGLHESSHPLKDVGAHRDVSRPGLRIGEVQPAHRRPRPTAIGVAQGPDGRHGTSKEIHHQLPR